MQWVTDHNVSVRGRLCIYLLPWCRCDDNIRRVFVLAGVLVFDGGLFSAQSFWLSSIWDYMSERFLIVDVHVDSQDLSCALVWLSAV
jgi:hypothetical protein